MENKEVVQIEIPELESGAVVYQDVTPAVVPPSVLEDKKNSVEKPSTEYALHIVFTQFVRYAERKLTMFDSLTDDSQVNLDSILGEGVDEELDRIIKSLGHISRRRPKPVIECVMYWRKSKSDQDAVARQSKSPDYIQAERRSLISIYVLSRVLTEVVEQTPPEVLGNELCEKLEDIVFRQLLAANPQALAKSSIRKANWISLAKLLGRMSSFRFAIVEDRFLSELEKLPKVVDSSREQQVVFLIQAMKYLQLSIYPEDSLEESAYFLESIVKFLSKTQNAVLRDQYATVLCTMFEPIANVVTVEANHPVWETTMTALYKFALELMKKSWDHGFELAHMVLSVAPKELFADNWLKLLESQLSKLKGKWSPRCPALYGAAARLLWVLIFRCKETLNETTKKLALINKLLFSHNRKNWSLFTPGAINASVYIIRVAFQGYQQKTIDEILFPLLVGSEANRVVANPTVSTDSIIPERALVAVRAYMAIMEDLTSAEPLPFPTISTFEKPYYFDVTKATLLPKTLKKELVESLELFGNSLGQVVRIVEQHLQEPRAEDHVSRQNSVTQFVGLTQPNRSRGSVELMAALLQSFAWFSHDGHRFIDVLCRNVANRSATIAHTATVSLNQIARIGDIRLVVSNFVKYMFACDSRFFTNYEMPSSLEILPMLRVYVGLLEIWVSRLQRGDPGFNESSKEMTLNMLWPIVEEIEGNGLYFLCSQDQEIRMLALRVLWLITEMDKAIVEFSGTSECVPPRVIDALEKMEIVRLVKESVPPLELSMPERSRINKFKAKKGASIARLADSDYGVDSAIWLKLFPHIMALCFKDYPMPVAICRNIICERLVGMHDVVLTVVDHHSRSSNSSFAVKHPVRTHAETVVDQWRIYLMVACTTLTTTDEQKLFVPQQTSTPSHSRKKSLQKVTFHHQRVTSARSIFRILIPLLGVGHQVVVDAIISGIACINVNTYKVLLEVFSPVLQNKIADLRRFVPQNVSPGSPSAQRIVTEITQIFVLTAHNLKNETIKQDQWIKAELSSIFHSIFLLLNAPYLQIDYSYQSLRRFYCRLLTDVHTNLDAAIVADNCLDQLWLLIESWSPYGISASSAVSREAAMKRAVIASAKDLQEQQLVDASFDYDKRKFDVATSWALAALCKYRMKQNIVDEGCVRLIHTLLSLKSDTLQEAGRFALTNLLSHSLKNTQLVGEVVGHCYRNSGVHRGVPRSYFNCLANVVLAQDTDTKFVNGAQLLALGLFKIGDPDVDTRIKALHLLRHVEKCVYGASSFPEFRQHALSSIPSVWKQEIFWLSASLAKSRIDETYTIFSELCRVFSQLDQMEYRDLLSVLLPWVQNIEFKQSVSFIPHNGAAFESYMTDPESIMVLLNLLEISATLSDTIANEVSALWVALCTGPNGPKNVEIVISFMYYVCLCRRSMGLIEICHRVINFLNGTPAATSVYAYLQKLLEPRWMVSQTLRDLDTDMAEEMYPHVAQLNYIVAASEKVTHNVTSQPLPPFSFAQLAAIFLADTIPSTEVGRPNLTTILHVAFCLADHFVGTLQTKARKTLLSTVGMYAFDQYEAMVELTHYLEGPSSLEWSYEDLAPTSKTVDTTPEQLIKLVKTTVSIMEKVYPDIKRVWAVEAVKWATSCPVRHVACRSFQIYRCLLVETDQGVLADMLARLSPTISETSPEIQMFSLQILISLNAVVDHLDPQKLFQFPQLFWATVVSLSSVSEREYIESLSTMSKLLEKWDFTTGETVATLQNTFPARWEGEYVPVFKLVLLGLRSANSYEQSHKVLLQLLKIPPNDLLVDIHYLPLALVVNLPRFAHAMETKDFTTVLEAAELLESLCIVASPQLARILNSFRMNKFWSKGDFVSQYVSALCSVFSMSLSSILLTLMGTLSNSIDWVKTETLAVLKLLFPRVDYRSDGDLASLGADIVSPLLRLLQTEYVEQTLEVLDEVGSLVVGKQDKDILRMSLGSKQLVKEYETTSSLYGIPEKSGWSIPMPAVTAKIVRHNIHAVFYTCDTSQTSRVELDEIPFGFERDDDYTEYHEPLVGMDSISTTAGGLASMDNMLTTLDDLDTFFTNVGDTNGESYHYGMRRYNHGRKPSQAFTESSVAESFTNDRHEGISIPQLYDKKVSLILNQSLGRTQSAVSFRNTFDDTVAPESPLGVPAGGSAAVSHRRFGSYASNLFADDSFSRGLQPYGSSSTSSLRRSASVSTVADNYPDSSSRSSPRRDANRSFSPQTSKSQHGTATTVSKPAGSDSSFRLESLLRGKRKNKKNDKDRDKTQKGREAERDQDPAPPTIDWRTHDHMSFQFP
ncbi:Cell morphogenesis protein PAG1 [Wickerhamiella sorbophila]|uniref:Cell morphogenesis protein PAG1 n=1 Tax=Wickerhamiella sorbophila TaxID=45607 RepID=A0A2T0FMI3_9ASCO|nr:Cell morphogenesis protein PAG1 [Wickerhamiella sorbophila]PRT56190.1 Cell morphogenesis protein PAG1 [Wickerhamiella sorbophila]